MIFTNSKGVKWYLNSRKVILPRNNIEATAYFFTKTKVETYLSELPLKYKIIETSNGYPMVKKI